jgi:predicted phosphodiesterase
MPEFDRNKGLYLKALEYYYKSGYTLISLGDYEELHRYGIKELKKKYNDVYAIERKFLDENRYYRIFGNHDIDWKKQKRVKKHLHDVMPGLEIVEALKFKWNGHYIFLAHGHQGNFIDDTMGKFGRIILRHIARPLGISSFTSPAKRYTKRRKVETEYYNWAKEKKVLFIVAHTHRPMFESLTKADRIRINIENMLRESVSISAPEKKKKIEDEIVKKKEEFERAREEEGERAKGTGLGQFSLVTPCYSNDGSCLHENGITCVELRENKMSLFLLYDASLEANINKHLRTTTTDLLPSDPDAVRYKRQILEEEDLEYIFTRIRLLS